MGSRRLWNLAVLYKVRFKYKGPRYKGLLVKITENFWSLVLEPNCILFADITFDNKKLSKTVFDKSIK